MYCTTCGVEMEQPESHCDRCNADVCMTCYEEYHYECREDEDEDDNN